MKKFKSSFNVYYEDTDAGGVVYYANYLKFIERARTDAIASVKFTNFPTKLVSVCPIKGTNLNLLYLFHDSLCKIVKSSFDKFNNFICSSL